MFFCLQPPDEPVLVVLSQLSCIPAFCLFTLFYVFMATHDAKGIERVLHTGVYEQIFPDIDASHSKQVQYHLPSVVSCSAQSGTIKLYTYLSQNRPTGLFSSFIARRVLRVFDVSRCAKHIGNHPDRVSLPLVFSSSFSQLC